MRKVFILIGFCISLFSYGQWTLTFEDNFEGSMRSEWIIEEGCNWQNGEVQAYNKNNITFENGNMVITAKREATCTDKKYTSGRVITGKSDGTGFSQRYGKIEARIKLPKDNGMWPAFWTLGQNLMQGGSWPQCGEIDIFEFKNDDITALGGCYYDRNGQMAHWPEGWDWVAAYTDVSEYHTYGIIWTQNSITWTLDGQPYSVLTDQNIPMTPMDLSDPQRSEFHEPHFLILNMAIGGGAGREPDAGWTESKMYIDWVRVYEDPNYDGLPTANAGNDKVIATGESVVLDGSESSDYEGSITYQWTQTSGPATAAIAGGNTATPTISNLSVNGNYEFELTVSDEASQTDTDIVVVTVKDASDIPISLNKPASASSIEKDELSASNVNDGQMNTRWASEFNDPQWIMIDLEDSYEITRVNLEWEAAYSSKFEIQLSNSSDFSSYETLITVTNGDGGSDQYTFSQGLAGRYIRVYGTERATVYGHSLYEFEVFGNIENQAVTGVSVTPTSVSLAIGGTQQLNPSVSPLNANDQNVSYSSSNNTVATANSSGLVTAQGIGSAIITVTTADGNYTATCSVAVILDAIAVTGVSVTPTSVSLAIGGTQHLNPSVSPSDASNQNVSYSSNNTSVATVNSSGLVTAQGIGSATITVTTADGGHTASCLITVESRIIPVTGISVTPNNASLTIGETQQLTALVSPSNASNQNVSWSSNNTSVATVNSSGLVTAQGEGSVIITTTTDDGSYTVTKSITVSSNIVSNNEITGTMKLGVYPNPVGNVLYIYGLNNPAELTVYNLAGIEVAKNIGTEINTSNLTQGTYILSVTSNYQIVKLRFVKK